MDWRRIHLWFSGISEKLLFVGQLCSDLIKLVLQAWVLIKVVFWEVLENKLGPSLDIDGLAGVIQIQGIISRHEANQNKQDQAHAFLPVVGTVGETDGPAGGDEDSSNPSGRLVVAFGRCEEFFVADQEFHGQKGHE